MVLSYLMLNKQAVATEEKEPELPTIWNNPLLQSLVSTVYLFNLLRLKYCVHFCCHLNDLSYFFFSFFIGIFKVLFKHSLPNLPAANKTGQCYQPHFTDEVKRVPRGHLVSQWERSQQLTFSWIHGFMHTGSRATRGMLFTALQRKKKEEKEWLRVKLDRTGIFSQTLFVIMAFAVLNF